MKIVSLVLLCATLLTLSPAYGQGRRSRVKPSGAAPAAAAAEEQNQNDDPAHITAAETIVATEITHKNTSMFFDAAFDAAHSMVFRKP